MSESVSVLDGVGSVSTQKLAKAGIHTVQQLSEAKATDLVGIRNASTFVSRAKDYLLTHGDQEEDKKQDDIVDKEKEDDISLEYLLEDHSWFGKDIVVALEAGEHVFLKPAKVYELCVEPGHRVSFLCEWVLDDSKDLCEMTFTPQVICHWNVDLPPLTVDIRKEDWDVLSQKHVLENSLKEVKLMQTIRQQNQSDF